MNWLGITTVDWLLLMFALSSSSIIALGLVFWAGAAMPMPLLPTIRFKVCLWLGFLCGLHGVTTFLSVLPGGIISHTTERVAAGAGIDRPILAVLLFGWAAAIVTWVFVGYSFRMLLRKGWADAKELEP